MINLIRFKGMSSKKPENLGSVAGTGSGEILGKR
jgi:hypothetical protein